MDDTHARALLQCEDYDLDWNLLPLPLYNICKVYAKSMKQTPTTILLGMLVLISFCLGHACIEMGDNWTEPIIIWIINSLPTGRCKSTFHGWMEKILEEVEENCAARGIQIETMLTNCTWEKFGDRLARGGARQIGLFDEVTSFFSSMNMYSSQRLQLSDTNQYQDFLKLHTGKSKSRETITGNCNYKMTQSSFTLMGFSQPISVLPLIKDITNNAKGFTSRMMWFFPKPVYCRRRETILTAEEKHIGNDFRKLFVDFLTELFVFGEEAYYIQELDKMKVVYVKRRIFSLTEEAEKTYDDIHDDWELNICKRYRNDSLIGALFSRGKSQVLRLSVPIEILLKLIEHQHVLPTEEDQQSQTVLGSDGNAGDGDDDDHAEDNNGGGEDGEIVSDDDGGDDDDDDNGDFNLQPLTFQGMVINQFIQKSAITVANSIVKSSINQLCVLTNKTITQSDAEECDETQHASYHPLQGVIKNVLLSPGKCISFTILIKKGIFRKPYNGESGKGLAKLVYNELKTTDLGTIDTFVNPGNKTQVTFLTKATPPQDPNNAAVFASKLCAFGVSLPSYIQSLNPSSASDIEESERHLEDFTTRKEQNYLTPTKRQRTN